MMLGLDPETQQLLGLVLLSAVAFSAGYLWMGRK